MHKHIRTCVCLYKWNNALSIPSAAFLLFQLYKGFLKQLLKVTGDEGKSKGIYDPREAYKSCGHTLGGQFELAHRQHKMSLPHRGCHFVLYPLALIFYKHPAGPQAALRTALKMSAKDKQHQGVHRQAEQDLQRSKLLPFILTACYCLSHAAMYSLVLLTISLLGETYMAKLEWQVVGRHIQVTLTSITLASCDGNIFIWPSYLHYKGLSWNYLLLNKLLFWLFCCWPASLPLRHNLTLLWSWDDKI